MKALTAAEMREVDRLTTVRFGIPGDQLMEAAGKSVVDAFLEQYGYKSGKPPGRVCVLCGKGNNGGDGFVVARHLKEEAEQVEVYLFAASRVGGPAERCIVVEDARTGIEAARRAAMRSIGVSHDGKDFQADQVVQVTRAVETGCFRSPSESNEIMQFRYGIRTAQNTTGKSASQRRSY